VHLKDKSDFGHKATVVVAGKGVVDVDGCLKELIRQRFDGHISVEHEADWKDSVPQVKHNIDFVKERENPHGLIRQAEAREDEAGKKLAEEIRKRMQKK
jgi:sugar phosphate isomerase/epimerase